MLRTLAALLCLVIPIASIAQPLTPGDRSPDLTMAEYLTMLKQISPAAHAAAQLYVSGHMVRCRRELPVRQLRSAFSTGTGDPTLMAMVRAVQEDKAAQLQRLVSEIPCRGL